jgi:regulator of sigma E protease
LDAVTRTDSLTLLLVEEIIFKIAAVVLIIFLALMIHEFGHFLMARLFGVKVKSVQIGHGREYFNRTDKKGTQWRIRLFPLGAHVDLAALDEKPFWQRALVIAGGPLINLPLPFILFPVFFIAVGQPSAPPVIVGIEPGRPAEKAGLEPGDRILAVDGVSVLNSKDLWRESYERGLSENSLPAKTFTVRRGSGENQKEFQAVLEPEWTKYIDDNISRSHARLGILWDHTGFKPTAVIALDGTSVDKNPALARKLFKEKLDHPVLITLKGPGEESLTYKIHPRSGQNKYIDDKSHGEYRFFYLGDGRNFYLRKSAAAQIDDGIRYAAKKIADIVKIPLQILPIDPQALQDSDRAGKSQGKLKSYAYSFTHGLALGSILIALINLLPLPRLDGGYILIHGIEAARRKPLSLKAKAKLFVAAFLLLYLSVLASNIDNVQGYIDSRLKKVHELVNWNRGE